MKVAAVICECNPPHNGHAYLFRTLRTQTKADYVLAVMSGNFVQRGEPALLDKHTRTGMLLRMGADAVIELPPLFAMSSAREFAEAAVRTILMTGITHVIGFGAEGDAGLIGIGLEENANAISLGTERNTADIAIDAKASEASSPALLMGLTAAARLLLLEDHPAVRAVLKQQLAAGKTYPEARIAAFLEAYETVTAASDLSIPFDAAIQLLASPNNLLAAEYIRALLLRKQAFAASQMTCHLPELYAVKRQGDGYHAKAPVSASFSSATSLRRMLLNVSQGKTILESIANYCPPEILPLYRPFAEGKKPLCDPGRISLLLNARILAESAQGFTHYADVSEALSNRLSRESGHLTGFSGRVLQLKTRQYTQLRVQRALLHIALGVTKEELDAKKQAGYVTYLRLLGFRRDAAPLLKALKQHACVPVVVKPAAYKTLIAYDVRFDQLYYALTADGAAHIPNEYERSPVIL